MSFRRDYLPLFTIWLLDDASGANLEGAVLEPTTRCRDILANHQLLWQTRPQGLAVFYTRNPWQEESLLGRISAPTTFDFSLRLPAAFFTAYQPDLAEAGQLHLYNRNDDGSLRVGANAGLARGARVSSADAIRILPRRFELPLQLPAGAARIELREQFSDRLLLELPLQELGGGWRRSFDLRRLRAGRVRLNPDNQPSEQIHLLLDDELAAGRAQGLVSIMLDQAQDLAPAEGYRFEARFTAR